VNLTVEVESVNESPYNTKSVEFNGTSILYADKMFTPTKSPAKALNASTVAVFLTIVATALLASNILLSRTSYYKTIYIDWLYVIYGTTVVFVLLETLVALLLCKNLSFCLD